MTLKQDPRYEALCKEVERRGFKIEDVPQEIKKLQSLIKTGQPPSPGTWPAGGGRFHKFIMTNERG
ncbi:MAG TPA: hypothetical protein DDW87_11075 [Firmicutes bacterium]|nr:hypothetical protein [Bacillota bacterium]